jgi:hypothetical protein
MNESERVAGRAGGRPLRAMRRAVAPLDPVDVLDGWHVADTHAEGEPASLAQVPRADTIIEPTPTEQQLLSALHLQTAGITSSLNENGELAASQDASGSTGQAQTPFTTIGVPAAPQAPVPSSASGVTVSLPLTTPAAPVPASPVPDIGIASITGANVGVPAPDVRESLAATNDPGVPGGMAAGPGLSGGPWPSLPQVSLAGQGPAAGIQAAATASPVNGAMLAALLAPGRPEGSTVSCVGPGSTASLPRCAPGKPGSQSRR